MLTVPLNVNGYLDSKNNVSYGEKRQGLVMLKESKNVKFYTFMFFRFVFMISR